VWPKADGSLEIPSTYLEPELITRAHAVGTKVLVSIGGAGTEPDAGFRSVAATETLRSIFATNLASFVKTYGYDGVDLDWESPQSALDRDNFTRLITELRKALPRPVLFTMAVGGTNWFGQWLDYAAIDSMIDYYNLMAYDQHGGWEGTAGHNAAIYVSGEADSSLNDQYFVEYLTTTRNLSARKVVLGVPFYGYRYDGSTTLGDDCGGDCSTAVSVAYKDVGPLIGNGWTRHWDATARVPWLTRDGAAGLIAYDDPESMDAKVHWALETRNLAGVFTWELSEDTVNGETPLFDAMRRSYDVVCP
jgi:chitinase